MGMTEVKNARPLFSDSHHGYNYFTSKPTAGKHNYIYQRIVKPASCPHELSNQVPESLTKDRL